MKVIRALVIAVVLIAAFSPVCLADSIEYVILGPYGLQPDCSFDVYGSYQIFGSVTLDTPAKGLEFTLPEFYATVHELNFAYPVTGDLETSAFLDFGDCLSGQIQIFSMRIEVSNDWGCPGLIRGVGQFLPSLVGCDDVRRDIAPPCSAGPPDLLTPPDSATSVPLSPLLSWNWDLGAQQYCFEGLGVPVFSIEYGTDPEDLSQRIGVLENHDWTLDSLQPDTRYFWRVKIDDSFWVYAGTDFNYSEIRTFTTEGPVPVKPVTWGELKTYLKN